MHNWQWWLTAVWSHPPLNNDVMPDTIGDKFITGQSERTGAKVKLELYMTRHHLGRHVVHLRVWHHSSDMHQHDTRLKPLQFAETFAQRWPNKPGKNVCPSVRTYVHTSKIKLNAATNQIVEFVRVDETFTMIWLSRSSEVRVKMRRWPQSLSGLFLFTHTHSLYIPHNVPNGSVKCC